MGLFNTILCLATLFDLWASFQIWQNLDICCPTFFIFFGAISMCYFVSCSSYIVLQVTTHSDVALLIGRLEALILKDRLNHMDPHDRHRSPDAYRKELGNAVGLLSDILLKQLPLHSLGDVWSHKKNCQIRPRCHQEKQFHSTYYVKCFARGDDKPRLFLWLLACKRFLTEALIVKAGQRWKHENHCQADDRPQMARISHACGRNRWCVCVCHGRLCNSGYALVWAGCPLIPQVVVHPTCVYRRLQHRFKCFLFCV